MTPPGPAPPARSVGRCRQRLRLRLAALASAAAVLAGCASPPPLAPRADEAAATALDTLPETCLQALYLRCSDEAIAGRLSRGGIAGCSVVYQTLLERSFGGDFLALLAWSRRQPEAAPADGDGCSDD